MILINRTNLDSNRLETMFRRSTEAWPTAGLTVTVRPSRSTEFSGACYYRSDRIYLNLGRRNGYPYRIATNLARARSNRRYWWREAYFLTVADAYQLALFLFRHEFYHWLIHRAGRNRRQKEGMCDRFAASGLVEAHGATVTDGQGRPVSRGRWDFQDLAGFVAGARYCSKAPDRSVGEAQGARTCLRVTASGPVTSLSIVKKRSAQN